MTNRRNNKECPICSIKFSCSERCMSSRRLSNKRSCQCSGCMTRDPKLMRIILKQRERLHPDLSPPEGCYKINLNEKWRQIM